MKKIILLLSCILLCACSAQPVSTSVKELSRYTNQSYGSELFDTVIVMQTYAEEKTQADQLFETVLEKLKYYNNLFDKYNSYPDLNNVKTINDNAGIAPVQVDEELIELLLLSKEYYELTDGAFDITIGNLVSVWHDYREQGILDNYNGKLAAVPEYSELEAAALHSGWEHIVIDEEASTVYIDDSNVSIDVGGVAKGFAAQKVSDILEASYGNAILLNAGESNIQLIHSKPDGSSWKVGIKDPDDLSDQTGVMIVETTDTSCVVTSGDYQQYFVGSDQKRYHHIINPATYYPAEDVRAVTVLLNDGAIGDILSTALFIMGAEKGLEFLQSYNQTHDPVEAIWVYDTDNHPDIAGEEINGFYVITSK